MTKEEIVKGIRKYAGLGVCVIGIAAMGACLPPEVAHAAPTDTLPVATQTVTPSPTKTIVPTNTPSPTPTAAPTSTPIEELSYEEEVKLLGVTIKEKTLKISLYDVMYYEIPMRDGTIKKRIVFVYGSPYNNETGKSGTLKNIYCAFNDKLLFTSKKQTAGITLEKQLRDGFTVANDELKNAAIIKYFSLDQMEKVFKDLGIEWVDSKYYDFIISGGMDAYLTKTMSINDFIAFYLTHVPKEYRVPVSEIDEVITEELPIGTVKPASYKVFTSKDGASNLNYAFDEVPQKNIVDDNVIHGYRTKNYYDVTGINHPYKSKIKI